MAILELSPEFGLTETLIYRTHIFGGAKSGIETRRNKWTTGLRQFRCQQKYDSKSNIDDLWAFYRARKGRYQSFLIKYPTCFSVIGESIGTGDANETEFALDNFPVDTSTGRIYFDDVEQASGWHYQNSCADGESKAAFNSAPGNGVVITGDYEYYIKVRFAEDKLSRQLMRYQLLGAGLQFQEVDKIPCITYPSNSSTYQDNIIALLGRGTGAGGEGSGGVGGDAEGAGAGRGGEIEYEKQNYVAVDNHVDSDFPTTNYPSQILLSVKGWDGSTPQTMRAYLKTFQTDVPKVLHLYFVTPDPLWDQGVVGAYEVVDTWGELTLTWNNQPAIGALLDSKLIPVNGGLVMFDIEDAYAVCIKYVNEAYPSPGYQELFVHSSEAVDPDVRPYVMETYS